MKPKVYRKKTTPGAVLAGVLRTVVILLLVGVVLFFLLRSWTVYDDQGAHIRFPWSEAAD